MASIKRRPDGVWRARYRDDAGRERSRHFVRKVDAQDWLDEITTSVRTGQYVAPEAGKVTFADFYADWSSRQVWVTSTANAMALAAGSVEFGGLPLRTIRRSHVETWVKRMDARGLAATTVRTRFAHVQAVFKAAVKDRRIAVDPADGVALPRLRRAEAAMRLPTVVEVKAMLDAASDDFATMIALAAFAGLRLGEINGLQLGDIDWLGRTLDIARQVQREAVGAIEVRAPKYNSERTVYAADELLTVLSGYVARNGITEPSAWLFPGHDGSPASRQTISALWRKTLKAASVSGLTMHDCRHFYASGLIAQGCDVVTVQRALGHASAAFTLRVYSHLWPTAEDRTRRAAGALFSAVLDSAADSPRTLCEG